MLFISSLLGSNKSLFNCLGGGYSRDRPAPGAFWQSISQREANTREGRFNWRFHGFLDFPLQARVFVGSDGAITVQPPGHGCPPLGTIAMRLGIPEGVD